MTERTGDLTRRAVLKAAALAELGAAWPGIALGRQDDPAPGRRAVIDYLQGLSRPDGGYAWGDQAESHLSPTFAVIGAYRALGIEPPDKAKLAEFVRTHHPFRIKTLERDLRTFEYQQIQGLLWLGADASPLRAKILSWKAPSKYPAQYEQHGYPVFRFELMAITGRELLGLPLDDLSPQFKTYLDARRRENGSYNNTPAADGGDGHVMNTWWGLQALRPLGRLDEKKAETTAWLRACQHSDGGFTYQPAAELGGVSDAAYTWAAVRALKELGSEPDNPEGCRKFLRSLANADGGFGPRPGWPSNPMATHYALEAWRALGGREAPTAGRSPTAARPLRLTSDLKVFTIQVEAHGKGSPAEAVDLAGSLKIHLWGAKNASPKWIARAQALARLRKVPVTFFVADEEYGTWVDVPGLGTYSHTSDIIAPAELDFGPSLAKRGVVSWRDYQLRRLDPLRAAGGRLVWQFGENEELVRIFLDDSLERGGFEAISTFHFGNPDFTNSEPFLHSYRGKIPYIALQDAHGDEPWWFADMTTGFRTLFLATDPTWDGWLEALKNDRVVAVRHDAVSGGRTWMHGGSDAVLEFVRGRERDWRWWDNPDVRRPLVSIVVVAPDDEFEAARPDEGLMVRVRCAWQNTTQGQPKSPITELVRLAVDGREVSPNLVTKKSPARAGGFADHYHQYALRGLSRGRHTVRAVVREVATGAESSRTIEFDA